MLANCHKKVKFRSISLLSCTHALNDLGDPVFPNSADGDIPAWA
jgi:hypothetical protein